MYGKPYHKMPTSSWMIPGGNRDQKRRLMEAQKYPMMSAIQKNLGGALSDVFFSCLTPSQQDHIGFTPKLKGPGKELWVSPSDILMGKVVLTPPYTSRLLRALTHQGIMSLGAEIEEMVYRQHEIEMEAQLEKKEIEMELLMRRMISDAVEADRETQQLINDQILEKATQDLKSSFQEVLEETVGNLLLEGKWRLEEAVNQTRNEMEKELCIAVQSRSSYLSKQYEFQVAWKESQLSEKYENQLKKHQKDCNAHMEKLQKAFKKEIKATVAELEAQHITDLLIQAGEKSQKHSEEKHQMEDNFNAWFVKHFENDVVKRDFAALELENSIKKLTKKCESQVELFRELFRHFQDFINFALKEKPGQAEYMLSLQKELQRINAKEPDESEADAIARSIIEYILKVIEDHPKIKGQQAKLPKPLTIEQWRQQIQKDREAGRLLHVVGENNPRVSKQSMFLKNQIKSLASLFQQSSYFPEGLPQLVKERAA